MGLLEKAAADFERPAARLRRPGKGAGMGLLKRLRRILSGRALRFGGRGKPLRSDRGGSRWSTYLTETVSYHH